jgi:hypothetical protein
VPLGLREAHAFEAMVVQDYEGVAIGDRDEGAGKIGRPTTEPEGLTAGAAVLSRDRPVLPCNAWCVRGVLTGC